MDSCWIFHKYDSVIDELDPMLQAKFFRDLHKLFISKSALFQIFPILFGDAAVRPPLHDDGEILTKFFINT
jgi:hypothetical protein